MNTNQKANASTSRLERRSRKIYRVRRSNRMLDALSDFIENKRKGKVGGSN
jgi:hypothetical protein